MEHIDVEYAQKKIEDLKKRQENLFAELNGLAGAIQILELLIKEESNQLVEV